MKRKLKRLFDLKIKYRFSYDSDKDLRCRDRGWLINTHMMEKFGDGKYHDFYLKDEHDNRNPDYTHKCGSDFYQYHEEWFEQEVILELDDEDFLI